MQRCGSCCRSFCCGKPARRQCGAVTALALLPALAGTLVGGVLADRCRKARRMLAFDLAAAGLALGAAAVAGNLPVALWIPAVTVGIPVVIVQYLGCSDAVLGVVQAVLSVGGLVGGALAARSRNPLSDRHAVGLLLGIAVLCAAMGVVLWFPPIACAGVALCGFGVMAAAMQFNVCFFARLQTALPQEQLGRVTGCMVALSGLTRPVGQTVYGCLFERFSTCPAGVLLCAGVVSGVLVGAAMRRIWTACPR